MKTGEKVYAQHAENSEWLNSLKFYNDEIKILKNRLSELASKNNHKDFSAGVEHFQNQFIIQKNNIDEISHAIKMNEEELQKEIKNNPVAADKIKVSYHTKNKETFEAFESNFNKLRSEFNVFAAKWM
jgi:hypothetical protein